MRGKEPTGGVVSKEGLTSPTPLDTGGIKFRPMSGVGHMRGLRGRKRRVIRISASWEPNQAGRHDTGKPSESVYCAHFLDETGILYSSDSV